ncbi:MAG: hypothetical protein RRA92_02935 [Gemmatimonadota bacterium]|nr:hypothetical protein [Gemmatimonadota bacterium]
MSPLTRHTGPGPVRRLLPALLAGLVVLAALQVARRLTLRPGGETSSDAAPAPLALPELVGCWELDAGAWTFADSAAEDADAALPPLLALPDRLLLLPDSIDEWRREERTYRAVPVAGPADAALAASLRWFPRGDTLWLVWSDRRVRAGIALRRRGDRLVGAGRAILPAGEGRGPLDARVQAAAWKVNCATGLRDTPRRGPRR